jgi:serine/threonine protein kinase
VDFETALSNVTTISGETPIFADYASILFANTPGIHSLAVLGDKLRGVVNGRVIIQYMDNLVNLTGLDNITGFSVKPDFEIHVHIINNPLLMSVMALANSGLTTYHVHMHSNFQLCEAPKDWGQLDSSGHLITYQPVCNRCSPGLMGFKMTKRPLTMPCIQSQAGLKRLADAKCELVNFVCLHDCAECTQTMFDAAFENLHTINGFNVPFNEDTGEFGSGWSISLHNSPGITSLKPFHRLDSLMGGMGIRQMDELTDLDGLENIQNVTTLIDNHIFPANAVIFPFNHGSPSIEILDNNKLRSAMAAQATTFSGDSTLTVQYNPALCDLPQHWKVSDRVTNNGGSICTTKNPTEPLKNACVELIFGIMSGCVILGLLFYRTQIEHSIQEEELKQEEQNGKLNDALLDVMRPVPLFKCIAIPDDVETDRSAGMVPMREVEFLDFISGGFYGKVYRARWKGSVIAAKAIDLCALPLPRSVNPRSVASGSSSNHDWLESGSGLGMDMEAQDVEAQALDRFRREVQILSAVRHHNIVSYVGFGRMLDNTTGRVMAILLMEYVEGVTLLDLLRDGIWNPKNAKQSGGEKGQENEDLEGGDSYGGNDNDGCDPLRYNLAMQVTNGIGHLHERHIIHRDIKPNNVLLNNARTIAKIADFGLAISMPATSSADEKHVPSALGNMMYIAPEVLLGKQGSAMMDVYSLGLVIWQIFSRKMLVSKTVLEHARAVIESEHHTETSQNLRSDEENWLPVRLPTSLPSGAMSFVPNRHLRALLLRCWHKDPGLRPTCKEIGQQLQLAMDSLVPRRPTRRLA